jgi:hypothetical protein
VLTAGNTTGERSIVMPSGTLDGRTATGAIEAKAAANGVRRGGSFTAGAADAVSGGSAFLVGGDGDLSSSGSIQALGAKSGANQPGGDLLLQPGTGNGSGRRGLIMTGPSSLPTTDPGVADAWWKSSGAVVVSGYTPGAGGGAVSRMNLPATLTVSTSPAYTSGDAMGGLLTFANAAAVAGGSGLLLAATALCKTPALLPILELWLFDQTFTPTADNAPFAPSDADMAKCLGVVPIAAWYDDTANSLATWRGVQPYVLAAGGTALFGQLVTRTAVTLGSTTDIVVVAQVTRD